MLDNRIAIEKIREIQRKEGFEPCFRINKTNCIYKNVCCWAQICLDEFKPRAVRLFNVVK